LSCKLISKFEGPRPLLGFLALATIVNGRVLFVVAFFGAMLHGWE